MKRDFYVVISMETKQPILSQYQIGANLFSDACISHHSAFEVFGYGIQVFYECYVATNSRLADVLKFMEQDGLLAKSIALKGGTAINLTIFDLPRHYGNAGINRLGRINQWGYAVLRERGKS